MRRTRVVPAAPARSASATWDVIVNLVRDALTASRHIDVAEIDAAMTSAAGVGRALISAGHLDHHAITLVAPPIHVSIATISGTAALKTDDPSPIPGGSTASDWTLHLPTPAPLEKVVESVASKHPRLSSKPAPDHAAEDKATASIDREAIKQRLQRGA